MSTSLRDKRKQETRARLIAVALEMFVAEGYDEVAAQALCKRAGVTRGALYHHFPNGKPDLFGAVFAVLQNDLHETVRDSGGPGSNERVIAYLLGASKTAYRRIVWEDGPNVLGWEAWRRAERDHWMDLIAEGAIPAGLDKRRTVLLGAILFGAIGELVMSISEADDRQSVAQEASVLLRAMLEAVLGDDAKSVSNRTRQSD